MEYVLIFPLHSLAPCVFGIIIHGTWPRMKIIQKNKRKRHGEDMNALRTLDSCLINLGLLERRCNSGALRCHIMFR